MRPCQKGCEVLYFNESLVSVILQISHAKKERLKQIFIGFATVMQRSKATIRTVK